ncbi:MAG: UPF0182 family protein, partial [Armatimonadetes bacterium]|nr:UPF0182 family protein [Armatimonadota bacterium]
MSPNRRFVLWFVALAAAFIGFYWLAEFSSEYLWYRADAYPIVFQRRVVTKLILFALAGLAVYALLAVNVRLAMRQRPNVRPVDSSVDPELRAFIDSIVRPLVVWLPRVVAVMAGLSVAEAWQLWLMAVYGRPFGVVDPQFKLDVGFYIYRLGAWRQVVSSGSTLLLICLVAIAALYLHLDQIRLRENELSFGRAARAHILWLVAGMLFLRGVDQWLSRYSLLLSQSRLYTGAGWTATHAVIPALAISALLAVVAAVVCVLVTRPGRAARPAYYAVGLHLGVWLLGAAALPALLQRVTVAPNEIELETPYLERAITSTRQAYQLDKIQERSFRATSRLTAADLASNRDTIADIRIWDHRPLLRTFAQLQEIRQYYDIVDVDSARYQIDGRQQQVLTAARELNHDQIDTKAKSWINLHLDYTHGYGLVVSSASQATGEGQPRFMARDIPPRTIPELRVDQPRIYFGEMILLPPENIPQQSSLLPQQQQKQQTARPEQIAARQRERLNSLREPDEMDYLLVGGREEFDFAETQGDREVKHRTRYQGKSGVPLNSFFRRLVFSLRLHSLEILVSRLVTRESRLIMHRQVTRRCKMTAPFLVWDTNPYAVTVDGRIKWICEGYTYSLSYPYSEVHYERQATPRGPQWTPVWNYLRNPVKAVVDAYDGTVELYVVDPADPLIQSYQAIYPGMMKPLSEVPPALRSHFRYPVMLFKTQADLYRKYHMTDPRTFYNQEDLWAVAREMDRDAEREAKERGLDPKRDELYRDMEPYYITMSLPGEPDTQFMLISSFTPYSAGNSGKTTQRDNLIAWMGALCDPERYGELVVYTFPKDTNVYGPLQVEARIDQDDAISQQITLWDRGGSRVIRGNLLVIPIESSLLYVEPLYLESEKRGLPELKRVIVVYEDQVVMEPTLEAALERLFGDLADTPAPAAP